jgi:hypothetical protein
MSDIREEALALQRQLDLACMNRDLKAARRVQRRLSHLIAPGTPINRYEAALRTYAANMHGWEIDHHA